MKLSKSKYCNGVQCMKMLWLDTNFPELKEEIANDSILDNGSEVGEVAKDLFGDHINIAFDNNLKNMINDTQKVLLNDDIVITEASFVYDDNFCSIDILKKKNDQYEIYEVKSSTEVKDIYIDDISYQYFVMKHLKYQVNKCFIIYINSEYTREGELELNKLFNIVDVTKLVLKKQDEVLEKIQNINRYMLEKEEPNTDIGLHCNIPYDCPFFKYCTKSLPANNVFKIRRMRSKNKFNLYHLGKYKYEDLLKENIDDKFKQQIEFELYNKEDYINVKEIKKFLEQLYYPLYFLDFETFQQPIPRYDDIKPYMQIPFQYSLHYIESENGELKHKEFLASEDLDPRRGLAERLVNDIPLNACTVAYNMMFEKMVLKNLAMLFPDLSDHLMNIYNNMYDLMIPFKKRDYYTKEMHGSYSIKYVLPALFPNDKRLDYHSLEMVHNGSEAMNSYANLGNLSKDEKEKLRYNLLKYCELDTYAMVKIWEKLMDVTKECLPKRKND